MTLIRTKSVSANRIRSSIVVANEEQVEIASLPRLVENRLEAFLQPFAIALLTTANQLSEVSSSMTEKRKDTAFGILTHLNSTLNHYPCRIPCRHQS